MFNKWQLPLFLKEDTSLIHLTLAVIQNDQAHYQSVEKPPAQLGALCSEGFF